MVKKIGFFITSDGWGGLEMNVLRLAAWLTEYGYNISLFSQESSKIYNEAKSMLGVGCTCVVPTPAKHFDFINAYKISKLLKSLEISTLFLFYNPDISITSVIKRLFYKDLKIIYQQHMQIGINKRDIIHTIRYSCLDYWICPLKYLADEVTQRTGFPGKKICIIPLGLETAQFVNHKYSKQEARNLLNISNDVLLIGIIGRISAMKGQLFLVKSLPELLKKNIKSELLIFGSPTINNPDDKQNFEDIKQFIESQNLGDVVHFKEHSKDVALFYNAIDIFVMASQGETYGMVTIEAMLSGVPIIATNTVGTPEILNYGKLGLLYTYNDFTSFSEKVIYILNNKDKIAEMVRKAKETAIEKYSHTSECNQIMCLL